MQRAALTRLAVRLCIFACACASSVPTQSQHYHLVYNPADGTLTIDTLDGTISNYVLVGNESFIYLNHQSFLGGTLPSDTSILSESDPFSPQSGRFNLGAVLPAGLTADQYFNRFAKVDYVGRFGDPVTDFQLVYAPEPLSATLLIVGGIALVRRRRRAQG